MPIRNVYLDCALPDGIEGSLRDEYKFINTCVPRGKRLGILIIILPEVRDFDGKELVVWAMCTSSIFLGLSSEPHVLFCRESGSVV